MQRPDPLMRLDATTEAVRGLRDIFAAEEPLGDVLDRIVISARQAIPNADVVSISVLNTAGESRTAACTDERVIDIDERQYASGRGPCLQAARSGRAAGGGR